MEQTKYVPSHFHTESSRTIIDLEYRVAIIEWDTQYTYPDKDMERMHTLIDMKTMPIGDHKLKPEEEVELQELQGQIIDGKSRIKQIIFMHPDSYERDSRGVIAGKELDIINQRVSEILKAKRELMLQQIPAWFSGDF